ncbi:hypothetical protein [Aliikangiella maris]|uniref:Uncharacterized protein n=2 Tax=Aliikangiella maris TaxID=3162458 RepID=A0ABV3MRB0_9GAMM
MKKIIIGMLIVFPSLSFAGVSCTISDFEVEVYDHGGTYIHGKLDGVNNTWINIQGKDGNDNATNRRLSIALAAQMAGKKLEAYFESFNSCTEYQNYTRVTGLKLRK